MSPRALRLRRAMIRRLRPPTMAAVIVATGATEAEIVVVNVAATGAATGAARLRPRTNRRLLLRHRRRLPRLRAASRAIVSRAIQARAQADVAIAAAARKAAAPAAVVKADAAMAAEAATDRNRAVFVGLA